MNWGRDLNARIPGAPNFSYREMIRSDTALRKGIINLPTETQWQRVEHLAQHVLQPIRNEFGRITMLSGFRTVALCKAVGSSAKSYHAFGGAGDIEPYKSSTRLFDVLKWIHEHIEYNSLIAEYFPEGWVHVGKILGDDRKILKLKDPDHHFVKCTIEYIENIYG